MTILRDGQRENCSNTTKGGEVKMKNKTILVVLCVVLLLLLTSLSYGWWSNLKTQSLERREKLRADDLEELLQGHAWQDEPNEPDEREKPSVSPRVNGSTFDVNLISVNNGGNITKVVSIRLWNCNLFFVQHKSESTSDEKSETFSSKK